MKYIRDFFKLYGKFVLAIIFILVFFFIAIDFLKNSILNIDYSMYDHMIKPFINDTNTTIFKVITNMGSSIVLILLSILSYWIFKNKKYTFYVFINLGLVVCLNLFLKEIFSRARPEDLMLIHESGYSFPSGHSMAAMAFYGFIIYLIWKTNWKKAFKSILSIFLATLIIAIGISRIYLGVHYLSDVLAGFAISLAYLMLYTAIIDKLILKQDKAEDKHKKSPLWKSFDHAIQGIIQGLSAERNMTIHFIFVLIVIMFGFTFSISTFEWIACILLFGIVISLELVNTAIENTIDICMPKLHPKAKLAKDTAAGAVLVAATISVVIGIIIFLPKILAFFGI